MAPDFEAETTEGRIRFHGWLGIEKRHTKIIGLSVDPVENHKKWSSDIKETQGHGPNYR